MDITFLMLTYFQKSRRTQHLTRAAEQLHVSQPALSKTLSSLEEIPADAAVRPHGTGITLNRNGEIFLQYTNRILAGSPMRSVRLMRPGRGSAGA